MAPSTSATSGAEAATWTVDCAVSVLEVRALVAAFNGFGGACRLTGCAARHAREGRF